MATDFTQESVLRFILSNDGQVRNADLLSHFRRFLREDDNREHNRELFKRYVNSVATVRQEEGVSHVVLRKKYRVHLGDIAKVREPEKVREQNTKTQTALTIPTRAEVLPAAGIVTNNNNNNDSTPSFERAVNAHGREQPVDSLFCPKIDSTPSFKRSVKAREQPVDSLFCPKNDSTPSFERAVKAREQPVDPVFCPKNNSSFEKAVKAREQPVDSSFCAKIDSNLSFERAVKAREQPVDSLFCPKNDSTPSFVKAINAHAREQPVDSSFCAKNDSASTFERAVKAREQPVDSLFCPKNVSTSSFERPVKAYGREQPGDSLFCPKNNSTSTLERPVRVHGREQPVDSLFCPKNDSTPSFVKAVTAHGREQNVDSISCAKQVNNTCAVPSDTESRSSGSGQSVGRLWESQATRDLESKHRQLREADGCERPSVAPTHCAYFEVQAPSPPVDRKTTNMLDAKHPDETWPSRSSLTPSHLYNSSPCLLDRPASPHERYSLSRSNDSLLHSGINERPIQEQDENESQGLSVDDPSINEAYLQIHRPSSLSSSHDSVSISDTGWPQDFGREEWPVDHGFEEQDVRARLRRNQEARMLSQLQSNRSVPSIHHSTGYLDNQDSRSSTRSNSPEIHRGPIARRISSRLRSRMCRSLGEDLDQPFPEDNLTARHNRLQLLSSTLSLGNLVSTSSSRGQSSRDLSSPSGSTRSLGNFGHDSSFSKQSSIPLEQREHDWFVKAASASWTNIYSLFREDPNLLSKRDFISGFTVVHWIAKHGDHRVLNTLWYGVEKVGMTLDVNSKSLCGYTPLHLAAIHGHKKIIRLLVQKFKADVRIRDSSGKRPWQYLSKEENQEVLELLGAPQKRISGCPSTPANLPVSGKVNVKRHTSIAALFKHKSHLRVSTTPEAF